MSLDRRWRDQLDSLRAAGRERRLQCAGGFDFSSNDYLGYAKSSRPDGRRSRSGTASRLLRGHDPVWERVECDLAHWHHAESALVFTSGYVANEGLLGTVIEPGDWVASDQLNHASIIDGLRLSKAERFVYRHADLNHLESMLRTARRTPGRELFIVTESLFGMEGDVAPLSSLTELARRHGAHLIVDEAHATGCFGDEGGGLVDALGLRGEVLATMHTGGKALAVPGAYVAGSKLLRDVLLNRCRHFMFTTALPPEVGSWWLDALARVRHDRPARTALQTAAAFFRASLAESGIVAGGEHYIVPLRLGDDERAVRAAWALQQQALDIRAIRPPTVPEGTARLRVSIHADHDHERLAAAAVAIARAMQECPAGAGV